MVEPAQTFAAITASLQQQNAPLIRFHAVDLFDGRSNYLNCLRLYYAYYNVVPSVKSMNRLEVRKAMQWLEKEYAGAIACKHYHQRYDTQSKKMRDANCIYLLKEGLLLDFEHDSVHVVFSYEKEEAAQQFFDLLKAFIRKKKFTREIRLLTRDGGDLLGSPVRLKKPRLNLQSSYNDDLAPVHQLILQRLRINQKAGLILLHGIPGTGKSTYIRYLIHHLRKPVIFVPPGLAQTMDSPSFMEFMVVYKNSVFIIEDAEELLVTREGNRSSSISMLLNLTDGLLGECLGIHVIATFNTHLSQIDTALMRKGRLTALYEFKPLCLPKAKALLQELGMEDYRVNREMTLAEIYHAGEESFELKKEKRSMGFQVAVVT